jgi:predicted esterase
VSIDRGRQGAALLGPRAQWRDYGMGHELCMEEIKDLRSWLHQRLR